MQHDSNPGPSPQTQGLGPKPAAEEHAPQPVEAADRDFDRELALDALTWLSGWASCHDYDHQTDLHEKIETARKALRSSRDLRTFFNRELDPRVTWSADYQLAEKLGAQLETLRADIANLQSDAWSAANISTAEFERFSQIKADLEAAIKTCNNLGLPF